MLNLFKYLFFVCGMTFVIGCSKGGYEVEGGDNFINRKSLEISQISYQEYFKDVSSGGELPPIEREFSVVVTVGSSGQATMSGHSRYPVGLATCSKNFNNVSVPTSILSEAQKISFARNSHPCAGIPEVISTSTIKITYKNGQTKEGALSCIGTDDIAHDAEDFTSAIRDHVEDSVTETCAQ